MQPQAFVTLTYPPHFLSTAVTIKSYFNHHPLLPVVIIIDDTNTARLQGHHNEFVEWTEYASDCEQLYRSLGYQCRIVKLSESFLYISKNITLFPGWLRQQMVKFYMDQLVPDLETWFFSDGDLFFFESTPVATPYSYVTEFNPEWTNYVVNTLQINADLAKHSTSKETTDDVTVSNPPWRHMSAAVLQGLRLYVEQTHQIDFVQYHYNYAKTHGNHLCTWSEWELIELYQTRVLHQLPCLEFSPPMQFQRNMLPTYTSPFNVTMLNLPSEQEMGRDWFEAMGVTVTNDHWNKIVKIQK